jgi:amino-acid N-acetyltransferase
MIRNAERSDYRSIKRLLKVGIVEGTLQPRKKKEIKKNLKRFVVAEEAGEVIGMASVVVYSRRIGEIRSLYVEPEHRGNGIARELVQSVIAKPIAEVPCSVIFAITQTPEVFNGFDNKQGQRHIIFKNI